MTAPDPSTYHATDTLRNGSAVLVRAVRPDDKDRFIAAFQRLSPESVRRRFFTAKAELTPTELRYLTELDFKNHVALAALVTVEGEEQGVGVVRMIRSTPADHAEVAFTVTDDFQGRGVATVLFRHLLPLASQLGIKYLTAEVLPENRQMLEVFEHSGLPLEIKLRDGLEHVVLPLEPPPPPGPRYLTCPKCGATMVPIVHGDAEVNRCESCGGLWFDLLELKRLEDAKGSEALDTGDPEVGRRLNQQGLVRCPVDGQVMVRMVDTRQPHIWLESCEYCHGAFLDAGEFRDLKEFTLAEFLRLRRTPRPM